jgi:hypothetical protein
MIPLLHMASWLSMALVASVEDQGVAPKQDLKGDPPAALVPAPLAEALKLDAEQRKKVDDLEQMFQKERKAAMALTMLKVKVILDRIENDEEPAPALAIASAVTSAMLDLKRSRAGYEKKVMEVLSEDQKRQFAAWKKLRPKDKKGAGPAGNTLPLAGQRDVSVVARARQEYLPPARWPTGDPCRLAGRRSRWGSHSTFRGYL